MNNIGPTSINAKMYEKKHVICIPRMDVSIPNSYIFKTFCSLKVGYVENVYETPVKNDPTAKRVFVYIKWNKSDNAKQILERFDNEQNANVVHSFPWYWICVSKK